MANVDQLLTEFNAIGVTDVSDGDFFLNISRKIDYLLDTFIFDLYSEYAANITLIIGLVIGLFFVVTAFRIFKGDIKDDLRQLLWRFGYPSIVLALITSYALYHQAIVSIAYDFPNEFGQLALKATHASPMGVNDPLQAMSIFFKKSLKAIDIILAVGDGWIKYLFVAGMFALICAIAIPILSVLLIAKVGTAVFLGMGQLFLLMSIFESTKGIFEAWLRSLIGFVLMLLLSHVLIALIMSIMHLSMMDIAQGFNGGRVSFSTLGAYFFLGGCSYFVVREAQGLAKGLAGGYVMKTYSAGASTAAGITAATGAAWHNRTSLGNGVQSIWNAVMNSSDDEGSE